MLFSLHIENVAIIKKSDIDFSMGFNVLTGETGAGKSIIIDSLNILLGNKASRNLISTGSDFAFVSAVFTDFNVNQIVVLNENGIFTDDDGNLIVSRKITADGRSYSKINGTAVTVTVLKKISSVLVNIHGQHDGSEILDPTTHITYLDEFCDNSSLIADYSEKYEFVKSIRGKIVSLTEIKEKREQMEEMLRFKIDEIDKAKISVGELQKLKETSVISANITAIQTALGCSDSLLNAENGVLDSVSSVITYISSVEKILDGCGEIIENLTRAKAELEDASEKISNKSSDYEDFNYSPDYIEQRIYTIEKIIEKYGSEQQALDALENFKQQLAQLEDNEYELERVSKQYSDALSALEKQAEKLSSVRREKAVHLAELICAQLSELDMPNIKFSVEITRSKNSRGGNKYTPIGFDTVEFLISPNAGEQLKPLSKIASGGELSRIILCLKNILNSTDNCQTVIYDEVDSGVSGSTAQKIGIKLKNVSQKKQVFSITHLAQIAALADHHYKVEKKTENGVTTSTIFELSSEERVYEVARIMGGVEITEQILKSASEMINNSKKC